MVIKKLRKFISQILILIEIAETSAETHRLTLIPKTRNGIQVELLRVGMTACLYILSIS